MTNLYFCLIIIIVMLINLGAGSTLQSPTRTEGLILQPHGYCGFNNTTCSLEKP